MVVARTALLTGNVTDLGLHVVSNVSKERDNDCVRLLLAQSANGRVCHAGLGATHCAPSAQRDRLLHGTLS
jgi:phosphoribosyl-AMP cyclohydrolase